MHRSLSGIIDRDTGRCEHLEGFGTAMTGDQGLCAAAHDRFRRLDAGALGRGEVLLVADDFKLICIKIVNQETGAAAETAVKRGIQVAAAGGKGNFQGFTP